MPWLFCCPPVNNRQRSRTEGFGFNPSTYLDHSYLDMADIDMSTPQPLATSVRLPAFPPHAVIKPSPEINTPQPKVKLDQSPDIFTPIAGSGGEGLKWAPKTKGGTTEMPTVGIQGKGNVRRCGWGHLPQNVLRYVIR